MLQILHIVLLVAVLIFLLGIIVLCLMYEWSLLMTKAPFISLPRAVVPKVLEALDLKDGSVCYDLGCGEGRILFACYEKRPDVKYVGLDKATIAIWIAKLKAWQKKAPIEFERADFFKKDLSDATHVFTYLFPGLMNDLLPKLKVELKPGTKLVSCDFVFKDKEPVGSVDLNRPPHTLGRKLFIYEF